MHRMSGTHICSQFGWLWMPLIGDLRRYAAHVMRVGRLVLGLVMLCAIDVGLASPIDDLASPSQETRDAAARILRKTWVPPARTNWQPLLSAIMIGMHETNVLELLRPLTGLTNASGVGSGTVESRIYRLDDLYLIQYSYEISDHIVFAHRLLQRLREVSPPAPPTNFTGIWVNYYANGQACCRIHYTNGVVKHFEYAHHYGSHPWEEVTDFVREDGDP